MQSAPGDGEITIFWSGSWSFLWKSKFPPFLTHSFITFIFLNYIIFQDKNKQINSLSLYRCITKRNWIAMAPSASFKDKEVQTIQAIVTGSFSSIFFTYFGRLYSEDYLCKRVAGKWFHEGLEKRR
jgi:hypothetical protein